MGDRGQYPGHGHAAAIVGNAGGDRDGAAAVPPSGPGPDHGAGGCGTGGADRCPLWQGPSTAGLAGEGALAANLSAGPAGGCGGHVAMLQKRCSYGSIVGAGGAGRHIRCILLFLRPAPAAGAV